MRVHIAHGEADQAIAEELQAYMKPQGLFAELETGARGFGHLQASDVVVVLWSRNCVFTTHRMQLEKRMLDAWADERLVLVKLDHHFLPVGLRDLPAIDGSFESARQMTVWRDVTRAAKERMNALLVQKQRAQEEASAKVEDLFSGAPSDIRFPDMEKLEGVFQAPGHAGPGSKYEQSVSSSRSGPPAIEGAEKSRGKSWVPIVMTLLVLAAIAGAFLYLPSPGVSGPQTDTGPFFGPGLFGLVLGAGCLLLLLILAVWIAGRTRPSAKTSAGRASRAPDMPSGPAPAGSVPSLALAAEEDVTQGIVFISYAHADDSQVSPVVTVVEACGRGVWIDKGGIAAGEGWAGEIVRAIKAAGGVMVMCSSRAFESDHVKREIYLADRYRKPMLPVFLEDAQPPEDFEYFFAGVQWLELFRLPEAERAGAVERALSAVG